MVCHRVPLNGDGSYFVAAFSSSELSTSSGVPTLCSLFRFMRLQPGSENFQSRLTVDVLAAPTVDPNFDAGWLVHQHYAGICLVSVLASGSTSASEGFVEVVRIYLDFVLRGFFEDCYRDGARVNSTSFVCGWDSLKSMAASFMVEGFFSLLAGDS